MKKRLFLGIFLIGLISIIGACASGSKKEVSNDKLQIMTSFYPMYDFTKHIVGEEAEVSMLISAGTEAHDYEPSAKDMKKIQDSDVFIYNNENMETWVPSMKDTLKEGKVKVIKATENMVLLPGNEDGHHHEHENEGKEEHSHSHAFDPHVWLAPSLAIKEVKEISEQLIKQYPDKKEVFTKNTEEYIKELEELDTKYQEKLVNAEQKNFVTQHAAFGYLAVEYGLNQVPIAGLSPDQEPSAAKLAELKKYVTDNKIKYIYFESNASDAVAKTLAKEAKVELLVLNTLEGLSDKDIKEGKNYVSVMTDNLDALSKTTGTKNQNTIVINQTEETLENGYFEDKDIKDRPLTNWEGNWQSVYPYVLDGTLDQVFEYKSKINQDKSNQEYKTYYQAGYETKIKNIEIAGNNITYTDDSGKKTASHYKYSGYKILTYEKGNRGVRYCFEAENPSDGAFKYVQFSDHTITDTKVEHFHLYFGNESHEKLYNQLDNWPTYYHDNLSGKEIAQEMLAH